MWYLCSLSKAFDAVYHHILLEELKFYGLQQYEVNWFRSYQCSRKQQIYVNSLFNLILIIIMLYLYSAISLSLYILSCPISSGIPQGSILGPLHFLFVLMTFLIPLIFVADYMQTKHLWQPLEATLTFY